MLEETWFGEVARASRRSLIGIAFLIGPLGGAQGSALYSPEDSGPSWSYAGESGPDHWGELGKAYETCATGQLQSPIDISRTHRVVYTPLRFQYRSQLLEAINTGRGVHFVSPPGSALLVRGQVYDLEEFNFHVPGEHRFKGLGSEAELHLVHRDPQGGIAVVAVPIRSGERENRILSRILEHLPMRRGERVRHRQVGINPLFLLPVNQSYFRYTGSLATPPCTEPVSWFVFKEPLVVRPWQIRRIAQAVGSNARPIQPLNGRRVFSLLRY